MPSQPTWTGAAIADDPWSFQSPRPRRTLRIGARGFAILGLATFALVLIATLPANVILAISGAPMTSRNAVGTIWSGETALGSPTAVAWRFAPLRSIMSLGLASDITVRGSGTDLAGKAVWRPGGLVINDLSGMAAPALVNTLISDLPFSCDLSFTVDLDRLVLAGRRSGADGALRSGPGACLAKNGMDTTPAPIPALTGRSVIGEDGSSAFLAPAATPQDRLAQLTIDRDGKLTAGVLPAGALMLPAMAGQISIETQL